MLTLAAIISVKLSQAYWVKLAYLIILHDASFCENISYQKCRMLPQCQKLCGGSLQVRKLQAERDWLQEQIEPGSVERPIVIEEPTQLPARPPVRHLSLWHCQAKLFVRGVDTCMCCIIWRSPAVGSWSAEVAISSFWHAGRIRWVLAASEIMSFAWRDWTVYPVYIKRDIWKQ